MPILGTYKVTGCEAWQKHFRSEGFEKRDGNKRIPVLHKDNVIPRKPTARFSPTRAPKNKTKLETKEAHAERNPTSGTRLTLIYQLPHRKK